MSFLSNSTYVSERKGGVAYSVSFEDTKQSEGERKKVYVGIARGDGPLNAEKVCVKIMRSGSWPEFQCETEVRICEIAERLAREFNRRKLHKTRINILTLYRAKIRDTSIFHPIKRRQRTLSEGDWVVFEPKINKKFKSFVKRNGEMVCDCYDDCNLFDTFIHFTYHVSEGTRVVCGLEGVMSRDAKEVQISGQIIHSVDQKYGELDRGHDGINDVFRNHNCNDICKNWLLPRTLSGKVKGEDATLTTVANPRRAPSGPPPDYDDIFQMDDVGVSGNSQERSIFPELFENAAEDTARLVQWYTGACAMPPPQYSE